MQIDRRLILLLVGSDCCVTEGKHAAYSIMSIWGNLTCLSYLIHLAYFLENPLLHSEGEVL